MDVFGIRPEVWFPVITLILGAILKGVSDLIFDERKTKREKEARLEQRLDAIQLRRVEFQRSTLLDLQTAMQKLARATGRASHEDLMAFRSTGKKWGTNKLSEEANMGALQAHANMLMLRVRVNDKGIRETADNFSSTCARHVFCKSEAESVACMKEMSAYMTELNERIGDALRNLDNLEDIALQPR